MMKINNNYKGFNIVCIGAGANGSHFFRNLLQDIATYKQGSGTRLVKNTAITIVDGDRVEIKNLSNQLFDVDDVDTYKVDALAERYGTHYDLDVHSISEYVTTLDEVKKVFGNHPDKLPVLVGLVDNNRTRILLHEYFYSDEVKDLLYVDTGVEGIILPQELENDPLADKKIESSGFSGQVVCGYKQSGQVFLPPVADVYPTILADEESVFPTQSCGDLILNNPQRCATNKMAAQLTNTVLNNLFFTGEIFQEEIIFNARYGSAQTRFIAMRTEREYKHFFKELGINDISIVS
ncbi:ThiF family adenylyltransferase [Viridibacillus arvi]|uniref:ThiF family adenylyltransferase n=1 Tax=Viridibacillus arvi TaxID=263475 RepID=UPI0034CE6800